MLRAPCLLPIHARRFLTALLWRMRCHVASEIHALWGTRVSGGEQMAMMILQHFAKAATASDACHQGGVEER